MKKCIVCGHNTLKLYAINVNMVEPVVKWQESDEYQTEQGEPGCCELCMDGIMSQQGEYMWNGEILMVFDANDEEYHQHHGKTYRPHGNRRIQFEYDERSERWQVMVR